jgi:hypothetical protein
LDELLELKHWATKKHEMENKTHEKLLLKFVLGINALVTKITVFETNKGTANGVVRLRERAKAERFAFANDALS